MGTRRTFITPLGAQEAVPNKVGSKSANLSRIVRAGFRVPRGFCVTTHAYERFLEHGQLEPAIRMELGRKPLQTMRWEEVWDTALRIRSAFVAAPVPADVAEAVETALDGLDGGLPLAVRSSAPGEDSARGSFAGLHESYVGVVGLDAVLDALRAVWASLWSDAALLYRRELELDAARSRMAVLVQEMSGLRPSGVAFARDPRGPDNAYALVEAVPGACGDLVDGRVDPDRWQLDAATGEVMAWTAGDRSGVEASRDPLLDPSDLQGLMATLDGLEKLLGWPPDLEWTGQRDQLTVLQARPITTLASQGDEERTWYLSLRPGAQRLAALCSRVSDELIPELRALGERYATEPLEDFDDAALADAIEDRRAAVEEWKRIYWDEFIPFAHGVRQLACFYNDAVKPSDPYEFVGLLTGESMLATQRNAAMQALAGMLQQNPQLKKALEAESMPGQQVEKLDWVAFSTRLSQAPDGPDFCRAFDEVMGTYMDVTYGEERIGDRPDLMLRNIIGLSDKSKAISDSLDGEGAAQKLERRLLEAVGAHRHAEAEEILRIGRISWRLRDDDNLLVGRLDSQLMRAVNLAAERLRRSGRLEGAGVPSHENAQELAEALRHRDKSIFLSETESARENEVTALSENERPRQLVGQPAAPGLASGRARRIRCLEDLGRFCPGEVLICDAIQPTMTQLVPLASAIVERRGGMLIHGAIIARELGIPCVNGIPDAVDLLTDGELVAVDGNLGIVTVGEPDFDLEFAAGSQ